VSGKVVESEDCHFFDRLKDCCEFGFVIVSAVRIFKVSMTRKRMLLWILSSGCWNTNPVLNFKIICRIDSSDLQSNSCLDSLSVSLSETIFVS
jgi:hypothetical protein